MKKIIWLAQAAFFYLFTRFIAALPRSQSDRIGKIIGGFLFKILRKRREIAIDNISQALPYMKRHPSWRGTFETAEEIALATFMNLGVSILEACRLYHGKGNDLIDSMEVRGLENFQYAKEKDKGVLCVTGHCGNWELMSLSFKQLLGESIWAIARIQNNPYLNVIIEKMRMGYGNKVIYTKAATKTLLSVIKGKGVIGMLSDQAVFESNGALIDFLGRKAWANRAPVVLARKTGVALVPAFGHREDNHHVLTFHPEYIPCGEYTEDGIQQDIQALSRYLEEYICAHPANWYWIHRRWKRAGEPV